MGKSVSSNVKNCLTMIMVSVGMALESLNKCVKNKEAENSVVKHCSYMR